MAVALLPDRLWDLVEPFLPIPPRRPKGGRPRVSNRACFTGIGFVLHSGIPWQMLPLELGCGSGMTCWRRLRDWQQAGVWDLIHFALLDWLARSDQIDWSRAVVDSCSIRAVYGGDQTGPNPTDRAKRGSKRHLICDGRGVPLVPTALYVPLICLCVSCGSCVMTAEPFDGALLMCFFFHLLDGLPLGSAC